MTILLFTDASSKEGYSCYAYRSSVDSKPSCGILRTMNIAAMEVWAIVQGLKRIPDNSEVLVISDFKSAVTLILNHRKGEEYLHNLCTTNHYKQVCSLLRLECDRLNVDAVWVCSKFPSERHLEVDQISKTILAEYLRSIK